MRTFTIGLYQLEVNDETFDDQDYDYYYLNDDGYKPTTLVSIRLLKDGNLVKSALIGAVGGGTSVHDCSVIVGDDKLVTCCSDTVFCISIPQLVLQWKTKADFATCFEIFKYQEDYLVHGEVDISRIDKDGNIVWQQSGADIFTTLEAKDTFVITDQYILATDWEHRKYKFDFEGNIID